MTDSAGARAEGGWSPFARPPWRDCEAAARAILRAISFDGCALHDMTEDRYVALRDRMPQVGLPRATTISRACGSWTSAIEQAAILAAVATRENYAA